MGEDKGESDGSDVMVSVRYWFRFRVNYNVG